MLETTQLRNTWYKVWFNEAYYDGTTYQTYEYAHGPVKVNELVMKFNATMITEWIPDGSDKVVWVKG